MVSVYDIRDLLKKQKRLCRRDVCIRFGLTTAQVSRHFSNLIKFDDIETFYIHEKRKNRSFHVEYIKFKKFFQ